MNYYNPIILQDGIVHSIDMVYVQYFSYLGPKMLLEEIRALHNKFPEVRYETTKIYEFYMKGILGGTAFE